MPATSLQDLYLQKLQLLIDAEQQGLDAMQMHRRQTEEQVQRLQQLIGNRGRPSTSRECVSMRALIEEAQTMLPMIQDPDTIDAFVIGAQQAMEHHEIAAYGTARSWAQQLGFDDDADVLQRTLDEEGEADKMLTQIAERSVNERASQGADREVGIASGGQGDRSRSGELGGGGGRSGVNVERGADMR